MEWPVHLPLERGGGVSLTCRGILFYRYRERARGRLVLETEVVKKAGLWL